jgi:hypothetical protein
MLSEVWRKLKVGELIETGDRMTFIKDARGFNPQTAPTTNHMTEDKRKLNENEGHYFRLESSSTEVYEEGAGDYDDRRLDAEL